MCRVGGLEFGCLYASGCMWGRAGMGRGVGAHSVAFRLGEVFKIRGCYY